MAELAIIMSMITVTSTAAGILGIIKRRCGASQTMIELVNKCAELVDKIRKLLKTLEEDTQVPRDTRRISTALDLRRQEFDAVLKNLEKMKMRTKSAHPIDRTEKFIKAQGWAKKIEAICNDLVHLRNGVENIASSWDVAMLVTKVEEVVTIDATKKIDSARREKHTESSTRRSGTVNYVDRIQMTMVKLTDANKEALNRYGSLHELSLPDALYEASGWVDGTCSIQLLQHSAELLHPYANSGMAIAYKYGGIVKKNINLAVFHFRVASSRGELGSIMELISHYDLGKDTQNVSKYVKIAAGMTLQWDEKNLWDPYTIGYNFENAELEQHLISTSHSSCTFHQSLCHALGLRTPKSNQKAVEALQKFDFGSYSIHLDEDNSNCLYIRPHDAGWYYTSNIMSEYFEILFESNQFLHFFTLAYYADIYSPREWKRYALHAANKKCVDAHIFLAEYYSSFDHRNEWKMKLHLRIAADAGNSQAQSVCRHLFGKKSNVPKEVKHVDDRHDGTKGKDRHRARTRTPEKNGGDSRKKRAARVSNKFDVSTK